MDVSTAMLEKVLCLPADVRITDAHALIRAGKGDVVAVQLTIEGGSVPEADVVLAWYKTEEQEKHRARIFDRFEARP